MDGSSAEMCDCINSSFANYIIPFASMGTREWQTFVQRQGIELRFSLGAIESKRFLALAMITPRPANVWRVAAMGVRPEARGSGVAQALLDAHRSQARLHGIERLELEVFAQNERAVRLYSSCGFETVCRLFGFEAGSDARVALSASTQVTIDSASAWARAWERSATHPFPWQVGGDAIAMLSGDVTCWQTRGAQVVFTRAGDTLIVNSLLDTAADWQGAVALLAAMRARWPELHLRAPQLQTENGAARAFRSAGWRELELHQILMSVGV